MGARPRLRGASLLFSFCLGLVLTSAVSHAYVPRPGRVIDAVADANKEARRTRALRYQVSLRIGEGPAVAVGELVSHPTGLARLELRAAGGLVERHILLGDQHSASRNARMLMRPRAFLPPLFVLQSNSGAVLEAALGTLGVDRRLLGLAPCGEYDCYVIGDPVRAIRRPLALPESESVTGIEEAGADDFRLDIRVVDPPAEAGAGGDAIEAAATQPNLWVDTAGHNVRRLEDGDGVVVTIGPYVKFEHLTVPRFWTIEEPGKREVRFEVEGVVEVNAPAAAFSKSWLMAPLGGAQATPDAPVDDSVSSLDLEPLSPTPAVSSGSSEEALEELGFGRSPGEGYDYPN